MMIMSQDGASFLTRMMNRARRAMATGKEAAFLADRADLKAHSIGAWTYGDLEVVAFNRNGALWIGRYCSFAKGATIILGGEHNTRFVSTYPFGVFLDLQDRYRHERTKGDVVIGHDVWVGRGATILSGVTIGHGAVIGANSVVAHDVPDYAIACGNPAKVVRFRFDEADITALLAIRWWDWPDDKVRAEASGLMDADIAGFMAKHGSR
jgi:acetyltransferase-like isoleucine patch superfamily enzyme